ncbi:flavin reductase (DIM6/NTAB) family NADH-FMN oxidoreductase RutF [Saccharomonospora amisosensis]|uniref:Flavin reductase (DIM6/NTAB) family NADH-FMN oxidoreductase RutF n=1 Tax=Saccharomonospora amisosensis TaxID=1128677 RepID=A0A7X5UKZ6_9PSEU|nr:flavin reductase family protein [Saccharomonospora amisosensis]NIJ09905.1 flavin reductase (DIM6/NTAB) family NADH-FMN oxidoreductase RutF [Saccharomonospora amisosensis]
MRTKSPLHRSTVDPIHFRRTMGRFTSGVTVVTTVAEGDVHGMTANGFLSVSLDPPLVLVSVSKTSRMASLLERTGHYGVSILTEQQRPHSRHFAGNPVPGLQPEFDLVDGSAFLRGSMAQIGCDVVDTHDAGDHLLYVGHVKHLDYSDATPLVFFTGDYRALDSDADNLYTH